MSTHESLNVPPKPNVIVPRGTLIHIGGLPFTVVEDVQCHGTEATLKLGLDALRTGAFLRP